ncbi:MAG: hypothetical protein JW716_05260 [Candidatus Aenigmarchaeota archaeon]|nr:hypothetical protein [Candidatus Aenigmarchaeota archaeon]
MAMQNTVSMDWSRITVVSVLAFLGGWLLFGLLGAVIIAIVVLVLMGIIKVR